jgi:hypothetical protein
MSLLEQNFHNFLRKVRRPESQSPSFSALKVIYLTDRAGRFDLLPDIIRRWQRLPEFPTAGENHPQCIFGWLLE